MPNYQRTQTITAEQFDGVNRVEGMCQSYHSLPAFRDPHVHTPNIVWVKKSDWVTKDGEVYTNEPYRDWETDRKSTRLNSSHRSLSRMPSSA